MRTALIALALVVGLGGTAEARRGGVVLVTSGDDVFHIRTLDADTAAAVGYGNLGYHYDYFGVFWLDLWRSGGEFCVYSGNTYAALTAEEVEALGGASVPWRYHLPPGLLAILALIAIAIMSRVKRRAKTVYAVAGGLAVIAAVLFLKGLDWEFMIPGGVAIWLAMAAYFGTKRARELAARATPTALELEGAGGAGDLLDPQRTPGAPAEHHASATLDPGPSRPLVVARPSTQPSAVPMRADDSVDGPRLLR